ncbi:MAG: hypothetical protein FJ126_09375 [Deltaproteobacteria bacterium]|nr:hypothetical protein [Deltaproteobacteria bacterium]
MLPWLTQPRKEVARDSTLHILYPAARMLLAWVAVAMLIFSAAPGLAQQAPPAGSLKAPPGAPKGASGKAPKAGAKAPKAAAKAPAGPIDAQKQFTIVKIEPDAKREEVRIFFSQPAPLQVLRANLRLLPQVRIEWHRSTVSPQGVVTLRGKFKYGVGYMVTLPDNLVVRDKTYVRTVGAFFLPHRPPKVEFVENKSVIERDSPQLLHVRAQNVKTLEFEGVKVPPLLLPLALATEKDPGSWERTLEQLQAGADQLKGLVETRKSLAPFYAPPLLEKQLFPASGEKNKLVAVSLPLNFRKEKDTGALDLIRVKDQAGGEAATAPRVFRITDLGLTYKNGGQSLVIWVTSLKAGTPVAGAQVAGFTRDMRVFPLGQTDQDGVLVFGHKELEGLDLGRLAKFEPVKEVVDKDRLVYLLARTADDVSFIEIQPRGNLKPEGILQVKAGEKVRRLKGHVFTERGAYRPGEKVYFKGTLREYLEGKIVPPAGEVCDVSVTNPKGEKVFTFEGKVSEFGTVAGEFPVESHWPLGTYTLAMVFGPEAPGEKPSAPGRRRYRRAPEPDGEEKAEPMSRKEVSATFQVQEFKPPRHFVDISFKQFRRAVKDYVSRSEKQAEFVRIGISGEYYAGGSVKHGQVRWKVHKSKTSYQVPGFEQFIFGYAGEEPGELIESGQAILDEKGQTQVEFPLNRQVLAGEHGLNVVATVVDFDGRAVTNNKAFQADPEILVGISRHAEEVQAGEGQILKVVVVQRDGKPIRTGVVQAEVLQQTWVDLPKRNEQGDVYWDGQEVWRRSVVTDLTLEKGEAAFKFDFGWGGRYLLAFSFQDKQGRKYASATPYQVRGESYAFDYRDRPYQPLPMSADRPAYEPGQTAKINVRPLSPVSRYLVTLEQAGIIQHRVVAAQPGPQDLEIPIRAEYAPNIYVSVLGVTPRGEFPVFAGRYDTEAPNFYWGNLNLSVRREVERLEVKISPEVKELKAEPGTPVTLDFAVSAKGKGVEAELAVAVVDEAVLALTGFKTPSLEDLARFDHPLGVFTGELRTLLVHQTPFYLSRVEPLTGGGGLSEEMLSKLRKRFEAVAYFNPALRTDAQGRAKVSFTLPDNMTTYRVYTVVLDRGSRFASQERPLLAARDFYLEPGIPSFFTQGDNFRFLVAAFNSTAVAGPVKFSAQGDAGLVLKAEEPPGPLNAKDSIKLGVTGQALKSGPALTRFGGEFQGRADAVELKLKVNSGHVLETTVFSGSFTGSGEAKVALPAYLTRPGAVDPGEVTAVLTLAGSPFLRMTGAIKYLLDYPYGCVEQVSSGVLALAALRELVQDGQIPGVDLAETDKYLKAGVEKLLKMQTDSGGFAYWPGMREAHYWGTAYAAAALGLARQSGLQVPEDTVGKMVAYLKKEMGGEKASPAFKAGACYLLALHGTLDAATWKSVSKDFARLGRESKLFLLLAAKKANLRPLAELQNALKPLIGAQAEAGQDDQDVEFYPRFRPSALALLAGREILPDDPRTQETALYLLGGLDRQGIWTSTSDTGWALVALGEHFKGVSFKGEPEEVVISQPGAAPQRRTLDPKGYRTVGLDVKALLKNPVVKVESPSGHTWLYKLELTAPRQDIAATGAVNGFKVRRTVKNTDGSEVIKVGDLVKVRVLIDAGARGQRYVVLDDPLPAGLVGVNTAFKTEEPAPEISDSDEGAEAAESPEGMEYVTSEGLLRFWPNHFEIRDDRVLAFCDRIYGGTYMFEYYARAVCEGKFVWPAAKAAAMYAPAVNGYSPVGELTVKGR